MIKLGTLPILTRIISKIDLNPAINKLKEIDIFSEDQKEMSPEQVGIIIFEIIADLTPQLGEIGNDIVEFVSIHRDITIEEAEQIDMLEIFNEIKQDTGLLNFFKSALQKKVEQDA